MNRIFHDIYQTSEEWFNIRLGKATASNFGTIMANDGKAFGEPAKKYAMRIALESITRQRLETYTNDFMQRGIELEPEARGLYEEATFNIVTNGGFMELGNYGASSDGLTSDGMIEIKSVIYSTHFKNIEEGFDSSYKWQIQGQMWIYDKQWCDFVSYCPEFTEEKKLHMFHVERDEEMVSRLQARLLEFDKLVEKYKEMV